MCGVWRELTPDCHLPQGQVCQEDPQTPQLSPEQGYKPKGERKDKEGKPKRHLWVSASKEGSDEDSGPSEAGEEDLSEGSSSSEDKGESGKDSPWSD